MPESPGKIRVGTPIPRNKHKALVLARTLFNTTIRAVLTGAIDDIIEGARFLDIDALWASLGEAQAEMEE